MVVSVKTPHQKKIRLCCYYQKFSMPLLNWLFLTFTALAVIVCLFVAYWTLNFETVFVFHRFNYTTGINEIGGRNLHNSNNTKLNGSTQRDKHNSNNTKLNGSTQGDKHNSSENDTICEKNGNKSILANKKFPLNMRRTNYKSWKFDSRKKNEYSLKLSNVLNKSKIFICNFDNLKNCVLSSRMELNRTSKKIVEEIPKQNTCAIVGNSGILLGSRCGTEINSHNFVVRMSIPPIAKFATDAGIKTNITLINRQRILELYKLSLGKFKNIEKASQRDIYERLAFLNDSILWYGLSIGSSLKKYQIIIQKLRKSGIRLKFAFSQNSIRGNRIWKLKAPTSGMMVLSYFLNVCEKIDAYGFFPFNHDANCRALQNHYYQPDSKYFFDYQKNAHNWNGEFSLLKKLHNEHVIRLITGEC